MAEESDLRIETGCLEVYNTLDLCRILMLGHHYM